MYFLYTTSHIFEQLQASGMAVYDNTSFYLNLPVIFYLNLKKANTFLPV